MGSPETSKLKSSHDSECYPTCSNLRKARLLQPHLLGRAAAHNTIWDLVKRFYKAQRGLPGLRDCMLGTGARRDWEGNGESGEQILGNELWVCPVSKPLVLLNSVLFTLCLGRGTFDTSECSAPSTLTSVLWPSAKPAGLLLRPLLHGCQAPWEAHPGSLSESDTGSQSPSLLFAFFSSLLLIICGWVHVTAYAEDNWQEPILPFLRVGLGDQRSGHQTRVTSLFTPEPS